MLLFFYMNINWSNSFYMINFSGDSLAPNQRYCGKCEVDCNFAGVELFVMT